jgi:hypothetical protein
MWLNPSCPLNSSQLECENFNQQVALLQYYTAETPLSMHIIEYCISLLVFVVNVIKKSNPKLQSFGSNYGKNIFYLRMEASH